MTDKQGGPESSEYAWTRSGQGGWVRFAEHTRNGLVYLDQTAAAAPLHTASHDGSCTRATTSDGNYSDDRPETTTAAAAADAEATSNDSNNSNDCEPEDRFNAQCWPGSVCPDTTTSAAAADAEATTNNSNNSSACELEDRFNAQCWPGFVCPERTAAAAVPDAEATTNDRNNSSACDSEDSFHTVGGRLLAVPSAGDSVGAPTHSLDAALPPPEQRAEVLVRRARFRGPYHH